MRYIGIDVHSSASVWCLLDEQGTPLRRGRLKTNYPTLKSFAEELGTEGPVVAGHEVGTQVYLVHDAFTDAGVEIKAFNAAHLRMIAASRKKTDKRDAYWIARALQTGMTPHPVHIPRGEARSLRRLLAQRTGLLNDRKRWQNRARAQLRARGLVVIHGRRNLEREINWMLENPRDFDAEMLGAVGLCERSISRLNEELAYIDNQLAVRVKDNEIVRRLQTIPGFGQQVATEIYALVDRIERFPNSRALSAYSGLIPSVRQTGHVAHLGNIIKEGSPELRRVLIQAAHAVTRSKRPEVKPLMDLYHRVYSNRGRKKIATVALAHRLLQVAFHVWRDGTDYDPKRLRCPTD